MFSAKKRLADRSSLSDDLDFLFFSIVDYFGRIDLRHFYFDYFF